MSSDEFDGSWCAYLDVGILVCVYIENLCLINSRLPVMCHRFLDEFYLYVRSEGLICAGQP